MYLTAIEVGNRYGVHKATIWRWLRDGQIPAPVKLSEQTTRWKLADLEAWERTLTHAHSGGHADGQPET